MISNQICACEAHMLAILKKKKERYFVSLQEVVEVISFSATMDNAST